MSAEVGKEANLRMEAGAQTIGVRRPESVRTELLDHYKRYFEVVTADTPELREEAYRLRYLVYCLEHQFERREDFPEKLEQDEYDSHCHQALLRHRPSGQFMGTIRLILPAPTKEGWGLPAAQILAQQNIDLFSILPRGQTGEISRFAVAKTFRRRVTDDRYPDEREESEAAGESNAIQRRIAPVITLGLIMAALKTGLEDGLTHACAIVEPALLRLLGRNGIEMTPIGRPVEYHGLRQPCFVSAKGLVESLATNRPEIWAVVTDNGRALGRASSLLV
jgi:N-acyl amino acid synthase of PEP-CTERM/exosortase system